jgi:hypothetical protein
MRLREQVIGALNLFSAHAGALAPADIRVGQALADVATISLPHERRRSSTAQKPSPTVPAHDRPRLPAYWHPGHSLGNHDIIWRAEAPDTTAGQVGALAGEGPVSASRPRPTSPEAC